MSTFSINILRPRNDHFVWLGNYINLFKDDIFWHGLGNSIKITVLVVIGSLTLGLICALILNKSFRGRGIYRSLIIVPWAVPPVAAVLVWLWIYDFQFGVLNYILRTFGFASDNVPWLVNTSFAVFSVTAVIIWKQFGIATIMLLAGLQTIDYGLYEAAEIDGASKFQRFLNITLPGLRPSGGVLILLVTVWTFREFTVIYLMTQGGPARATETLVLLTFIEAFNNYNLGYASSMGIITFVVSIVISVGYYKLLLSKRGDE